MAEIRPANIIVPSHHRSLPCLALPWSSPSIKTMTMTLCQRSVGYGFGGGYEARSLMHIALCCS